MIAYLRQPPELYGETKENAALATTPGQAFYCREIGKSAERVVAEIESHGGQCMEWEADFADPGSVPMLFDKAEKQWGTVDIIVNNAAFDQVGGGNRMWCTEGFLDEHIGSGNRRS